MAQRESVPGLIECHTPRTGSDMPSTLAWLDHDTPARERTKRILALFQERGTVHQLGLGGIRDSFADLFFPGTSTIQTRLRYFLFVPWIYSRLEEVSVPSRGIAAAARERELTLTEPLLSGKEEGVFGRVAGGELKRLPSEVYWGGLGSWGIRRFDASREQYHRTIDGIYRRRKLARRPSSEGTERDAGVVTWHPEPLAQLPRPDRGPSFQRPSLSLSRRHRPARARPLASTDLHPRPRFAQALSPREINRD